MKSNLIYMSNLGFGDDIIRSNPTISDTGQIRFDRFEDYHDKRLHEELTRKGFQPYGKCEGCNTGTYILKTDDTLKILHPYLRNGKDCKHSRTTTREHWIATAIQQTEWGLDALKRWVKNQDKDNGALLNALSNLEYASKMTNLLIYGEEDDE